MSLHYSPKEIIAACRYSHIAMDVTFILVKKLKTGGKSSARKSM